MKTHIITEPMPKLLTGPQWAQARAAIGAIKLEKLGMKHSRGSVRKHWAVKLGLKPTAKADAVIAAINAIAPVPPTPEQRDAAVVLTEFMFKPE